MPNKYIKYLTPTKTNATATPQSAPIPGSNQVPNSAGGYSWGLSHWDRLKRFLILGTDGGTYYISEKALTIENANTVLACIREDGVRVVTETAAISDAGRAPKNDPAIFVLALVAAHGDEMARRSAFAALPKVCRTGTHLFQFAEYVQAFRGWGRALRRGVGQWYTHLTPRSLAYQLVKYRQRNGWTHTDLLRLSHARPDNETQNTLFKWVTKPDEAAWARDLSAPSDEALAFVWAFERAQQAQDVATIVKLIEKYDLPREALPTQFLNAPEVWDALLVKMPMTAMLRNLGVMARVGLLSALSVAEHIVVGRLENQELLRKARIHPIALLSALKVYGRGHGERSDARWIPTARVIDALDAAFYLAFGSIEPSNKRMMLALDVSGSMGGGVIAGVPGLTPRDASAVMAMVTARTEEKYALMGFATQFMPLNISPRMRLDDVVKHIGGLPFGGTDCARPMLHALDKGMAVDTFVVYTDSETWHGAVHPAQALVQYREKMGIPARMVVVGMTSNNFTIADPHDPLMLDVVGFDTTAPQLISDFARGEI
ncbi:MAG: TROVE domain-containing protein [Anaerolineae bacterium]